MGVKNGEMRDKMTKKSDVFKDLKSRRMDKNRDFGTENGNSGFACLNKGSQMEKLIYWGFLNQAMGVENGENKS
jgi:hypothetical protein